MSHYWPTPSFASQYSRDSNRHPHLSLRTLSHSWSAEWDLASPGLGAGFPSAPRRRQGVNPLQAASSRRPWHAVFASWITQTREAWPLCAQRRATTVGEHRSSLDCVALLHHSRVAVLNISLLIIGGVHGAGSRVPFVVHRSAPL